MIRKVLNWMFVLYMVLGALIILGTAGASDLNTISVGMSLTRIAGGFGLILVGFLGFIGLNGDNVRR